MEAAALRCSPSALPSLRTTTRTYPTPTPTDTDLGNLHLRQVFPIQFNHVTPLHHLRWRYRVVLGWAEIPAS